MNPMNCQLAQWSTTAFGVSTSASEPDTQSLQAHLSRSRRTHGRVFGAQCHAQFWLHFFAARIVSSAVLLVVLAAVVRAW